MRNIDRRRFLQVGGMGVGLGLAQPSSGLAQTPSPGAVPGVDTTRVRMFGDGVSLSPSESAALWTYLAGEGRIIRDSYSNGGTVEKLEREFALLLGKERAVFMPTGTLANHLAVRSLAGGVGRAIVQAESHLFNDSGDCVQTLSGITLIPLAPGRATFTLDDVKGVLDRTAGGRVATPVSVISLESPVRRRWGETFDETEMGRIVTFARSEGIRLHLDGARIFLQSAYTGRSVAEDAEPFDTVYVSLYKYFNAASGAILAGPRALLDDMYHPRRMFGAGLPGAWPFASIALHYVPGFVERFSRAVTVSEQVIDRIASHDRFTVDRIPAGTNLFRLLVSAPDLPAFRRRLGERGVDLPAPESDPRGFLLGVNETWNRKTADELADILVSAVSTA
jgi:threonine aldolase